MLSERQTGILRLIIREYIRTAQPVSSEALVRQYALAYSSATVRNELARLEEAGYLSHPHTSAGRVPLDKGYRFYVESLIEDEPIGPDRQRTIRHQFHQAAHEVGDQLQLAASVLAGAVRNLGLATVPLAPATRMKQVQFVALQERTALMVVVMSQGWSRQQYVELPEASDQDELSRISNRLNDAYAGKTVDEMGELADMARSPLLAACRQALAEAMAAEPEQHRAYLEGLRNVLEQPEFARSDRMLEILDVLNQRDLANALPLETLRNDAISVVIGEENRHDALHDASVVVGRYTGPEGMSGALGVIGPMRMDYARAIATVRYVADVVSELLETLYSGSPLPEGENEG